MAGNKTRPTKVDQKVLEALVEKSVAAMSKKHLS
jgi:hypothetical protein